MDVTQRLSDWKNGDKTALDELTPLIYEELRRLAGTYFSRERANHTLQPTALINEAYIRLVGGNTPEFKDRSHFLGVAAQLMRQVLVDHARSHNAEKRGGGEPKISLDEAISSAQEKPAQLVALDDALTELSRFDPRKAEIVELRYFGGLTIEEIAEHTKLSLATVGRDLRVAQAWLFRALDGGAS
jgi:RNA polymerase sigma factor (TIGR02999 family)